MCIIIVVIQLFNVYEVFELILYVMFWNKNDSAVSEVGVVYKGCTYVFNKKYRKYHEKQVCQLWGGSENAEKVIY